MKKFFSANKGFKICTVILVLLAVGIFCQPKETYFVFADDQQKIVRAADWQSPASIIRQAGISLGKDDGYHLSGNILQVIRTVEIDVINGSDVKKIKTGEPTIALALKKAGLDKKEMATFPAAGERPVNGMKVVLLDKNEQVIEEKRDIAYKVESRPDSHMEIGDTAVIREGIKGSKNVLVKLVTLTNGEVLRKEIAERIFNEPKAKIVALGTTNEVATSRGAVRFKKVVQMHATAYTPWDEGCIGITKSGIPAKKGVVAVDPSFIPLGTRLYIPGYGHALAADTGGAIQGNRIDLCVESKSEAFAFGRRDIKVYILE